MWRSTVFRSFRSLVRRTTCSNYHSGVGCHGHKPLKNITPCAKATEEEIQNKIQNAKLLRLVTAYREFGHRKAKIDPLNLQERTASELEDLSYYGFDKTETTEKFNLKGILNYPGGDQATIPEILSFLEETYCGTLSVELQFIPDRAERHWLANLVEESRGWTLDPEKQRDIAKIMLQSQTFDQFMSKKFPTVKRYGCEGAETMMGFFDETFSQAAKYGIEQVLIGMPHRGRLNLLTGMLKYPPAQMFSKMKGNREFPAEANASGDVLSHLTSSVDLDYGGAKPLHVSMLPNPSHLEAVNPVALGKTRSRQMTLGDGEYTDDPSVIMGDKAICVLNHGDAAFAGQGIVTETFALSNLPHFDTGGTIHLVVNNQLGFTTPQKRGRSSEYSTCVGKMNGCPVLRVNADHPEEISRATRLAFEYRMKFRKDVIIDLICFRKWGHNEVDDPSFTNPIMYQAISNRRSIPDLYSEQLVESKVASQEELDDYVEFYNKFLNEQAKLADSWVPPKVHLTKNWASCVEPSTSEVTVWDTGVPVDMLRFIGAKSVEAPEDHEVHSHLVKTYVDTRLQKLREGTNIDWATAEALAFGSLMSQGFSVRLSGQDVGRGTFSHRHAMLVDQEDETIHLPLNHITEGQGFLEVANSPLSEEAVLGFEYGMSVENPNNLIIWEAQFGDFFNTAQVIIDTFVASGETKWLLQSGLVMLLPHGMDGAGPEHSSSHIERFLQMTDSRETHVDGDSINMHIVNPTTPAQYFHVLRRQMMRNFRKPLVIISPKMLLRYSAAVSTLAEMSSGTFFAPVIGDREVKADNVRRVVLCSGKHYYTLAKHRQAVEAMDTALIRLEALTPFPARELKEELVKYPNATEYIWGQEEHRNMGAWSFVSPRMENILGLKLSYAGRDVLATPATGYRTVHQAEEAAILQDTFPVYS